MLHLVGSLYYIIINVYKYSCKVAAFLARFSRDLNFLNRFFRVALHYKM